MANSMKTRFPTFSYAKPVRLPVLVSIFVFASLAAEAQSKMIIKVFRLIPSSLVYEMTDAAKDSLLQGKTYYPSSNDSESILAFNYGESVSVKDYMYVSMSYETSQRGSGMVELRSFDRGGRKLIIVSTSGGVEGVNYQQQDISAFLYDGKKNLSPFKAKLFPDGSEDLFVKSGVPDSIRKVIVNNSNLTFNFSKEKVTLGLNSIFLHINREYREWLKGDQIKYTWTGKQFIAGSVSFSDIDP